MTEAQIKDRVANVQIRWMIRRDMPEVMAIEHLAFEFPWTEEDVHNCLRHRECIGMVAERDDTIVGYMFYELNLKKRSLHVLNFAVMPSMQRRGIGSQMVRKLVSKLSPYRRKSIVLEVRESNLDAQLFFAASGFVASKILKGHYEDSEEDAYVFKFEVEAASIRGDAST
ncbi:ribosomal protein S18-alanine N-acetyltransferase [Schlesneria sp. T3-172]|uniref:ribosomal protein S18-alanine N-acetyltransferase n=1 Tax=Schlesneria sphaerica TaxID=3373610 RepID=UPI0037C84BB9